MEYIIQHIRNAENWQLIETLQTMRNTYNSSNNTLTRNIASEVMNKCSLEINKRNG